MTDFDKLKKRVKDMGGKVVETEWGWEIDIGDDSFTMFHECGPNAEGIVFWNTYLDGRDAKARARRCVKRVEHLRETDGAIFGRAPYDVMLDIIRREFGIEEATDERT